MTMVGWRKNVPFKRSTSCARWISDSDTARKNTDSGWSPDSVRGAPHFGAPKIQCGLSGACLTFTVAVRSSLPQPTTAPLIAVQIERTTT
jgi:hypothetical protein